MTSEQSRFKVQAPIPSRSQRSLNTVTPSLDSEASVQYVSDGIAGCCVACNQLSIRSKIPAFGIPAGGKRLQRHAEKKRKHAGKTFLNGDSSVLLKLLRLAQATSSLSDARTLASLTSKLSQA